MTNDFKPSNRLPIGVHALSLCLMAIMATQASGCLLSRMTANNNNPFSRDQVVLNEDAELTEIVEHLNRTCYQVQGWQSTDATVHITGIPVPLKAMIAVQEPMRARLSVSNPLGQSEFQAGSNDQLVWSWEKRDQDKRIITVSHEEIPQMIMENGIPVSPDWLMQIVGLIPYDATRLKLERNSTDPNIIKLTESLYLDNMVVQKQTQVDLRRGVVVGHDLYDARGTWLVSAKISDYRKTDVPGIILPVEYELRIPNARQGMTIKLATLEVNPAFQDDDLWNIPQIGDCRVVAMHPQGSRMPSVPSKLSRDRLQDGLYQQQQMAWEYDLSDPKNPKVTERFVGAGQSDQPPVRTAEGSAGTAQFDLLTRDAEASQPWQQNAPVMSPGASPAQQPTTQVSGPSDVPEWAR